MAIKVSTTTGSRKINSAANSVRAMQAKSMLTGPAEVSDSGATAVKSGGTLSKIGNTVGRIAGVAAKFLPGVYGTIAQGVSNLLNDPEWWQTVPGDAITLNVPLRDVEVGTVEQQGTSAGTKLAKNRRYAIAEFTSCTDSGQWVINPSNQAITQYLMPEIRKVVNAVPLQAAGDYRVVLMINATIYAMWRQLRKYDYVLKHGQTYIANLNDPYFPLLQVENAAKLQSMINRLEEYLRANVRLPHTLCEYLAWRFGRVYKSNNSAKAALVMYNVMSLDVSVEDWEDEIGKLMNDVTSSTARQQANTDLYNAYYDHDIMIEIRDDTQFRYDMKEFMLRTNCNVQGTNAPMSDPTKTIVHIDSSLDNPTAFMASTVSTIGIDDQGNRSVLFPVRMCCGYIPFAQEFSENTYAEYFRFDTPELEPTQVVLRKAIYGTAPGSHWARTRIYSASTISTGVGDLSGMELVMQGMLACKSLDIYNKGLYLYDVNGEVIDMTALSIDAGIVDDRILGVEHVYAFANLTAISRKTSMSYAKAEKLVARDTANLIEKLDVATVAATPAQSNN